MDDNVYITLGQHGAQIKALQEDMTEVRTDVKAILAVLSEAKGGWRVVMLVAGASSAFTMGAIKAIPFLGMLFK